MKNIILSIIAVLFLGCSLIGKKEYVSSDVFLNRYFSQRSTVDYWQYEGVKDGDYVLYRYVLIENGSVFYVKEKCYIPVKDIDSDFLKTNQKERVRIPSFSEELDGLGDLHIENVGRGR